MRVPLSWLKEFVDVALPVEVLAERLTTAGLEVSHIEYIGLPQQTIPGVRYPKSDHLVWDREKILLGAIREVKRHPEADRLLLAMVDYGGPELEQCVTGAPNIGQYAGLGPLETPLWTPFAMEGAQVWDGHSEERKLMTLKGKSLRGIYNKSMVCSEKELGISDEHEGILLLDPQPNFVPGTPLADVLGDVILHVELTPNFGHALSILGVAREVAALTGQELREPSYVLRGRGAPVAQAIEVEIRDAQRNPRFTLTLLRGAKVQPSPQWMQRRLKAVGQRPINNIVDVTNYVMFEMGQPLHAFDYDKLLARAKGRTPKLITRLAREGETLKTLDGQERALSVNDIVIADNDDVAISLAAVMGGYDTEIDDNTTNVLLEAATWDFISVRRTAHSQKLFSEASTRFSRNLHPSRAILGNQRGMALMQQVAGGEVAEGLLDAYPQPAEPITISLPLHEIKRLLGIEMSVQQAAELLTRLQFDVTLEGETLHVTAPTYRTDIGTGVIGQADLIEELARLIGYDRIPDTIMADEMPPQRSFRAFEMEERVRDLLVSLGLRENISYRFSTPEAEARLVPPGAVSSFPQAEYVALQNPISADKTVLRHTLLAGLLENAARNLRYAQRQQVFEIGSVYLKQGTGLPAEPLRLGLLMTGARRPAAWPDSAAPAGDVDFYDLKGLIEGLLEGLHIRDYVVRRSTHSSFHPGRSADLLIAGQPVGAFGQLHPLVAQAIRWEGAPVLMAELDLEALISAAPVRHTFAPLPTTPAVLEDIAIVVREDVPHAEVEALIRRAGGPLLKDVRLFDVYRGSQIGEGHKSLAYALTYQTNERTLTDKDVQKIRQKIVATLEKQLEARLRA
ncbi:MAG: phenylalanine--tRNA ligase subunit beta [Anaerolineae bacterium]|nr:phenylalanine--tRNA ligase subunit beta [Anaerolineae bacterium]MDW8173553.1 phenylalanine--tRNA ligase subunit beta [Anaerolineae bacterium]